ncbi:MAG: site-specific integrase [Thermoplasmata archaeon]|nr:site-specific integrase [Thermoplasmata archaeon]
MDSKRRLEDDPFADAHFIAGYIAKRVSQLRSDEIIGDGIQLGRSERDAILEFVQARRPEVGELRVRTYLSWLPLAASRLGSEFLAPTKNAPASFVGAFPSKKYARGTRATAVNCLGTFWRWWLGQQGREYPSSLRIRLEKWKPAAGPSDMLTRDDVALIAENALNFRDRAWIWTLFNSGCRPGEIYRLRVGDVVPHDEGYIELKVTREKGSAPEPAPIYEDAVPALLAWLNAHPRASDRNAPLWVDVGGERAGKTATYRAMYKALESAAARAKTTKPVTAYALRRSRLTILAKDPAVSTSILEKIAGWVPGSNVARHYVHLSGKDVIGALNARYGVKVAGTGEKSEAPRSPTKCGRCRTVNPSGAAFCMTCGGPLSLPAVKLIDEARSAEERLADLLRRPEAVEFLATILAEQEKGKHRTGRHASTGVATGGANRDESMDSGAAPPPATSQPQRVVSLADAERLIGSGYEFVAPLGVDKAVVLSLSSASPAN